MVQRILFITSAVPRILTDISRHSNQEFHYHEQAMQIEGMGKKLVLSTNREKLERDMLAVLPLFRIFRKYGRMTLQEFAAKFKDPFLQKAIRS